jgi:PHD/YefM family antitoxin component YafN of YafNO toxin-antitoxin module
MVDLRFELNADVSVSDLRNEKVWSERLDHLRKLRILRRGNTLGVLVSLDEWETISSAIAQYEAALEDAEDAIVKRLIDERAGASRQRGQALKSEVIKKLKASKLL